MNPLRVLRAYRAWNQLQRAWKGYQMRREPVLLGQVITSAAVILAALGFALTAEQTAALVVVANLIAGVVMRSKVTPTA